MSKANKNNIDNRMHWERKTFAILFVQGKHRNKRKKLPKNQQNLYLATVVYVSCIGRVERKKVNFVQFMNIVQISYENFSPQWSN